MTHLISWCLLVFGLTYLITASAIAKVPRAWLKRRRGILGRFLRGVLSCAPCTSFWVGLALGEDFLLPSDVFFPIVTGHILGAIMAVGLVSGFQFVTAVAIAEEGDGENDE